MDREGKNANKQHLNSSVKFGLSERHTKFEKNLPHGFDKSAYLLSKRQNHKEDFFKLCVLLKKSQLYRISANSFRGNYSFLNFLGFMKFGLFEKHT